MGRFFGKKKLVAEPEDPNDNEVINSFDKKQVSVDEGFEISYDDDDNIRGEFERRSTAATVDDLQEKDNELVDQLMNKE